MNNREIAVLFENIATLLEIEGENRFKIIAYRRAAENISSLGRDLKTLVSEGALTDIPGIGKAISGKIGELVTTGKLQFYEDLISRVPESLLMLADIPEMGPKRIRVIWKQLGIVSVEELEKAAEKGELKVLEGFGPKIEANILSGIRKAKKHPFKGRIPIGKAWETASLILSRLGECPSVEKLSLGGSLRRRKDTIGDIDILAASKEAARVMQFFSSMEMVKEVILGGKTKTSIRTSSDIQVDLRVIPPESWGTGLQYFTGNQEHNVRLRELALSRGYSLSEYCLKSTLDDKELFFDSEEKLYEFLGLSFVEPELRQGRGELELATQGKLPDLVKDEDIRGDLQCHTDWSDGRASLSEMVEAAVRRGLEFLLITDHSKGLGIARGVDRVKLGEQAEQIDMINRQYRGRITVLKGVEVEVLADGSLDLDDRILSSLDMVVAAVHSSLRQGREQITERYIRALENPFVHILAHPTGRLIGEREGADADWERVFRAAASSGTILEINAAPQRLDLSDSLVSMARDLGCRFAISTDAHLPDHMDNLFFGVGVARRAGLTREDVFNTFTLHKLMRSIKRQ
jgi:DNA polymerase (family 10)